MASSDGGNARERVEAEVRRRWAAAGLPPRSGLLGRGGGPVLRQMVGSYTPGDPPVFVAGRAVAADIDARAAMLAGDRAFGTLRREGWRDPTADPVVAPLLDALGIWTGGEDGRPYDTGDRTAGVQRITARLAASGILVARDGTIRLCPSCAAPRSPERAIYHEELGDTFLVRFPLPADGDAPAVDALAWVDAPWRVLGTTALLVSPDLPYATVEYRRGELVARLLTLRSSIDRLRSWLPGAELKVVEERPGRAYAGRRYEFPLRHEFPDGASLPAPSGTVQPVAEVGDSGTGVVPLVPGHGGSDALIAERLGVVGWPLLTVRGTLDLTLMHKYAGLDIETGNEFVARDLTESGSVLARLRVLRGVPYCGVCGRPLVWYPGRCWCLEPSRLPPEALNRYARLLPGDRPIGQIEVTPWPVSETTPSDAPEAVRLRECERCYRLEPPEASDACPCGGRRRVVARRLVPSVAGAFGAWARNDPIGTGDKLRLYVGQRRRAPAIVHHLVAMAAVDVGPTDLSATVLPSVSDVDLPGLLAEYGADAVRSAFVRTGASEGPGGSFVERCRQEHRRLERLGELAASIGPGAGSDGRLATTDPELLPEDRALLARWGQTRLQVIAAYDEGAASEAHRRLVRFAELDLLRYREIARARLDPKVPPAQRRAAIRTLAHVLGEVATALAPIAPFTAEKIARSLQPELRSLFSSEPFDREEAPPDEALADAWDRWLAVVRAVDRFRSARRISPTTRLPSVALVLTDEALADRLRGDRELLQRIAGVGRIEVGSPRTPWEGRQRHIVPVESEIQRAYPALATQIVHLLRRLPVRRAEEASTGRGLSVFVQGQPQHITPSMLAFVESLPERFVPTPFPLGEMYAELPAGEGPAGAGGPLALSSDAAWLVRRVAQRLRPLGADSARSLAVRVLAIDPLARELREHWSAIAARLGVASLTIDAPGPAGSATPAVTGRTRLGSRWSVEIPGLDRPRRPRERVLPKSQRGSVRRMPLRQPTGVVGEEEVDYSDTDVIRHEEEVRLLGEQLDKLLGAPLLGPAKVAIAWDAGYASLDDLQAASFDEISTLPGFGRPLAVRLFSRTGREPPPAPPRAPRARTTTKPPPLSAERLGPSRTYAQIVPATPQLGPEPAGVPGEVVAEGELGFSAPEDDLAESPPVSDAAAPSEEQELPLSQAEPSPAVELPPAPPGPEWPPEEVRRAPAPRPPPPPLQPAFVPDSMRPAPVPVPEPPVAVGIELQINDALLPTLQPFLDATAAGHRGLAVVRELPERIRTLVGPRPVAVYWLTNLVRDRTVRPGDLKGLGSLLHQALVENGISALFLEGVEYLSQIHGSGSIAAFLKELDDLARQHEARVWVRLTPGLLSGSDLTTVVGQLGGAGEPAGEAPMNAPEASVPEPPTPPPQERLETDAAEPPVSPPATEPEVGPPSTTDLPGDLPATPEPSSKAEPPPIEPALPDPRAEAQSGSMEPGSAGPAAPTVEDGIGPAQDGPPAIGEPEPSLGAGPPPIEPAPPDPAAEVQSGPLEPGSTGGATPTLEEEIATAGDSPPTMGEPGPSSPTPDPGSGAASEPPATVEGSPGAVASVAGDDPHQNATPPPAPPPPEVPPLSVPPEPTDSSAGPDEHPVAEEPGERPPSAKEKAESSDDAEEQPAPDTEGDAGDEPPAGPGTDDAGN